MGKCQLQKNDPHDWQFAYVIAETRPFPEAVWVCHCSAMKRIQHFHKGHREHPEHPDNRYRGSDIEELRGNDG